MSDAIVFALGLWIGGIVGMVGGMVLTFDRRETEKEGAKWDSSGQ